MNDLYRAAFAVEDFLCAEKFQFCFIGGLAVLRWGEPRQTLGVDLCVLAGIGDGEAVVDKLLRRFSPRRPDAREFAVVNRVLLLQEGNVPCDVSLGALPFEEEMMMRASRHEYDRGISLTTCSAEDLLVTKVFAGRPRDLLDAEAILSRNKPRLDLRQARRSLEELNSGLDTDEFTRRLDSLLSRK